MPPSGKSSPAPGTPARLERLLEKARIARTSGHPNEALTILQGARQLKAGATPRRELVVAELRERSLAYTALGDYEAAHQSLALALENAGETPTASDGVRAEMAVLELMADRPEAATTRVEGLRGRGRRATLIARARLELFSGSTHRAEQALQAAEQAPGGIDELAPPAAALRSLVQLWEGRPEQARLLMDGVMIQGNPYWDIVRLLTMRALWIDSGDARYLRLALGIAEQLRFETRPRVLPGLVAAALSQHAVLLALTGQTFLAVQAADEALDVLGPLTLPEWPRAAMLHDLAVVFRDAGEDDKWTMAVDLWEAAPSGMWPERMLRVTGPRARGAVETPAVTRQAAGSTGTDLLSAALQVAEADDHWERALLRELVAHGELVGARWTDAHGSVVASAGVTEALVARDFALGPGSEAVTVFGDRALSLDWTDDTIERLARMARRARQQRQRHRDLLASLELAKGHHAEAVDALERVRRGPSARVAGGAFPSVAGRSRSLAQVLDQLGHLAGTRLPVLVEGEVGTGRRHLARALAAYLTGEPEGCVQLDLALVPEQAMVSTLSRVMVEASMAPCVISGAHHLTPEAASWFLARLNDTARGPRWLVTLDTTSQTPTALTLRDAMLSSRVRVPRLDERLEDLPDLIDALVVRLGGRPEQVGTAARSVLARRLWPGHVAELREALADAVVRAGGKAITPEHLSAQQEDPAAASLSEGLDLGYHAAVKTFRERLLLHALKTTGGNRTQAAKLLDVQRTYFMRLIRDLDTSAT